MSPPQTVLLNPPDKSTNYQSTIVLKALKLTNEDVSAYKFQISADPNFTTALESEWVLKPVWEANDLKPGNFYFWCVCTVDSSGNQSAWTEPYRVFIDVYPYDFSKNLLRVIPNYIGPDDLKTVKIVIGKIDDPADSYRVRINNLSGKTTGILVPNLINSIFGSEKNFSSI